MSSLSEKDLALLSTIIYCDYFLTQPDGANLQAIVQRMLDGNDSFWESMVFKGDFRHLESNHERGRQEAINRYKEALMQVQESPGLQNIKITEPMLRDGMGITAACFVNTGDNSTTVVFRGTDGSYKQWYDNFEGAGTDGFTPMQELAREYMERITERGYNDVTVTGHSKGGNLAAFVTLFSPIVDRCVSFNGQGFSEYFHHRFKDEIDGNSHKIRTIAAYNDFVNLLMFSIAGETIYVNNNNANFSERHYMSNLIRDNTFDDNGNFILTRPQENAMQFLKSGLDTLLILMPAPVEEWFTDTFGPLVSLVLGKGDVTSDDIVHALTNIAIGAFVATLAPILVKAVLLIVVAVALVVAVAILIDWAIEQIVNLVSALVDNLIEIAKNIGQWAVEFANSIKEAVSNFARWIRDTWERAGRAYAAANPYFKVDTAKLRDYANRINSVNNRLSNLDRDMWGLFWQVGLLDLWDILVANFLTSKSPTLIQIQSYLNDSAGRFDTAENKSRGYMGG